MEFSKLLEERRSIREYQSGVSVSRDEIEQMIYAAQQAPSWKNTETGRYYVAISKDAVEKVRNTCLPEFNRERTANASAYIVTAFESGFAGFDHEGVPKDELGNGWGAYDLALQNQNLILKAREMGYDTLILGSREIPALRELFNIPESQILGPVIALGKRTITPDKPERKSIEEILKVF